MPVRRIDHSLIRTLELAASRKFYSQGVGFNFGPRSPFNSPGVPLHNGALRPQAAAAATA